MYSIFIADDEAIIREGIKCLLDYEALGYRICGEAANGDQALERILALEPDVVLMDIRMPGISGLEAIRKAREAGYRGKILIVSSYTDFKYAQEAIRCGVRHYITKPIDEDELAEILKAFRAEFEIESQERASAEQYQRKVRGAILRDILRGGTVPDPVRLDGLGLTGDRYQVVAVNHRELQVLHSDSTLRDYVIFVEEDLIVLMGQAAIRRFHELLEFHLLAHHGNEPFPFFACGKPVDRLEDLVLSCGQATALKSRQFFCQPAQYVLTEADLPSQTGTKVVSDALVREYAATFLNCIQSFNRRKMAETLKELGDLLTGAGDAVREIRLFLTDLYLQVREQMGLLYPGGDIPFFTNAEIIYTIGAAEYLHEIIGFLSQRFEFFMDATGAGSRDSVLDDILHYIHHNYASNITLENIAPLFGYNRSYLGKIFTKKMGQNFNSYVDHVRIEKSKELLLKDNAKVYHIAERVGYKNVDYFHIKFKKYVGMSPAEYRKRNKCTSGPPPEDPEKGPLF